MKKSSLIFIALLMALGACNQAAPSKTQSRKVVDFDALESNNYEETPVNKSTLGEFDLVAPYNGKILTELETFSWTASENAQSYTIEICSHPNFIFDNSAIDYYKQTNIDGLTWTPSVTLQLQDTTYYWRVFAYNKNGQQGKRCETEAFTFFMEAVEVEEFKLDLGEADDWQLHPTGSPADISIDNNNFFGNGEPSVVVSFKKEDTMRGIPESDGWIVVTKTIEKSIYGTDALYFDLFYAGQDANIFIRLIDRDNEFWVAPVKVSLNAKQSVVLKFDEFVQRTGDVTVANQVFDHERIKYFEIVFEKSFGDGILLLSDVKAIKFSNYSNLFIDKLKFTDYTEDQWVNDSYEFEKEYTDYELTIKYWGSNGEGKPSISSIGYGFVKIKVNQFFDTGDTIKVKMKYTGSKGKNVIIRIYEEDTDRWSYTIPYSSMTEGEYMEMIIPFEAFGKSSILGDGKRQFFYINNIQFGIEGQYGTGTASYKDFEIVKKKDYQTETIRTVTSDGVIENFDSYTYSTEAFMIWSVSDKNKDEYIRLDTSNKAGGSNNKYCGQFEYKCDMERAEYYLPLEVQDDFESLSLWLKDASMQIVEPKVTNPNAQADMTIYIELSTGEIYGYHIPALDRYWYQYIIPFTTFELLNRDYLPFVPHQITGSGIERIGFTLQYYYYDINGKGYPLYTDDNKIFVDNMTFGHDSIFNKVLKEKIIHMGEDNLSVIDDFEEYATSTDLNDVWINGGEESYQLMTLSNNVSSEGGNNSAAFQFKSSAASPVYYLSPAFDTSVKARAIKFSMACDKSITVYFNLFFKIGTSTTKYRVTFNTINTGWTEYIIGLKPSNFSLEEGNAISGLNANYAKYISRVSFGMSNYDGTYGLHNLYIDNIILDFTIDDYPNVTTRVIGA